MIKYNLICENTHDFEAWFSKGADYDAQASAGQIACPHCASTSIEKAIMAPNVSTSRSKTKIATQQAAAAKMMNDIAGKVRDAIASNCENVGDKFANEARAIHYGEKPERGIYGKATAREALELKDEGVGVMPLPDVIAPKDKDEVN